MLWVGGRSQLCALNCMALTATAMFLGVHYLVLSSCDGSKGAHTESIQDCPRLGIMQLWDEPRALVVAAAILQQAACHIRTRSVIVWRNLLCSRSSGRSSSPQPMTVNSQILKRHRAVQTDTSHKGDINPLKHSGHYIDHQIYHRKVCV
jgi:hypothetical protein